MIFFFHCWRRLNRKARMPCKRHQTALMLQIQLFLCAHNVAELCSRPSASPCGALSISVSQFDEDTSYFSTAKIFNLVLCVCLFHTDFAGNRTSIRRRCYSKPNEISPLIFFLKSHPSTRENCTLEFSTGFLNFIAHPQKEFVVEEFANAYCQPMLR